MTTISWAETLTDARQRAADEAKLLLTYIYSPG